METLINKPIYKYTIGSKSQIIYKSWINCCFISSFQIQMKKLYGDFPDLDELLNLLYKNNPNAFTHFAYDFPEKWFQLKEYLCSKNKIWSERLEQIVLRICIPTLIYNQCVLISFIDINRIIPSEIAKGNDESLEKALSNNIDQNKKIIDIIQFRNHFEPINIISTEGVLKEIKYVSDFETFFS
jgi:hypothetical protein